MKAQEDKKVRAVFTALQAAAVLSGVLGTLIAALLADVGAMWLSLGVGDHAARIVASCVVGFAVLIAVSALCWLALVTFFRMCGRLKRERAFTEVNELALRRIARCFAGCSGALAISLPLLGLLLGESVLAMIWIALIAFLFFFLALIVHALERLVRRAELLQTESDLTV